MIDVDAARRSCPKRMTHGPCGGVSPMGDCEVPGVRCPFTEVVLGDDPSRTGTGPDVRWLADLRLRPGRLPDIAVAANRLSGVIDAFLLGEHLDDDLGFTQAEAAAWCRDELAVPVVVTIAARDRDRTALERDVDDVAGAGVLGMHCVTGDHPAVRFGDGRDLRWGLDSFDVVRAARAALDQRDADGIVSVAESPTAPPRRERPARAEAKVRAGADVVVCNHTGDARSISSFASAVEGAQVLAPVALLTDREEVARLDRFPGLDLHAADVERIVTCGADVARSIGVDVAVDRCIEALRTPGVRGVNLSGVGDTDEHGRAALLREIVERSEQGHDQTGDQA